MSSTMTVTEVDTQKAIDLNYTSHPADLVDGGKINSKVTVEDLRRAIPAHCFKPTYRQSLWYLFRDLMVSGSLMAAAYTFVPQIENNLLRYAAWATYGYVQGLAFTGLWVLGHECGHTAFSPSQLLNDTVGWVLHSFLLTPYFSWKSTHRRHHIYANNLVKDHNFVPPQRSQYASALNIAAERLEELTEDSPIVTFLRIVVQQVCGFPWYLAVNITASQGSLNKKQSNVPLVNSHFNFLPSSTVFRPEELHLILLSDIGIGLAAAGAWYASTKIGFSAVALLYLQPYMWVNHWIVAITYLHHTHPNVPKYEEEAWTFLKGAMATVDREFGWVGKHMLHNIIEYHVIHHLFSRIPQYHAEEATKAIIPLMGKSYHSDKNRYFIPAIWEAFTKCQYVVPDDPNAKPADRAMWYKPGPSPPPEFVMSKKGWAE
ncbi:delta-12 fatty acid desaturase [Lasallia pustulata]|uniref:Delta-12 fatty acid desaturase n=1 Tax=Lasallia pustulata TaxID=136370 RepID=A0A1W5D513_9LECA|nr:delta-12 fatty acid desaturase [Lasallia pustulata]